MAGAEEACEAMPATKLNWIGHETMWREFMLLAFVGMLAISGCDTKPVAHIMLEVNDENCKSENIARVSDKTTQQEFAGKCIRRGEFKPSPKKEW